jgi:hypothetical protein
VGFLKISKGFVPMDLDQVPVVQARAPDRVLIDLES